MAYCGYGDAEHHDILYCCVLGLHGVPGLRYYPLPGLISRLRSNADVYYRVFNGGSPFNRSTSDNVNLDALIEHYREKNRKMEEKIRAKTQD